MSKCGYMCHLLSTSKSSQFCTSGELCVSCNSQNDLPLSLKVSCLICVMLRGFFSGWLLLYIIHTNIRLQRFISRLIKGPNYRPRTRTLSIKRQSKIPRPLLHATNFHHCALACCLYEKDERESLGIFKQRNNPFLDIQLIFGLIYVVILTDKSVIAVTQCSSSHYLKIYLLF